jgi:MFS family permease
MELNDKTLVKHDLDRRHSLPHTVAYWVVAYVFFLILMGSTLPTPLYTIYQARWHFSTAILTLIFATYYAGVALALLVVGRLSDIVGRRRVLLAAVGLGFLGTLGFLTAQGVAWLLVARLLIGFAVALCTGTATAALVELHPRGNTRAAALVGSTSMIVGFCVGVLASGLLVQYAPWPTELIYGVYLVLLLPALLGLWSLPETAPATSLRFSWRPQRLSVPGSIALPFLIASFTVASGFSVLGLFLGLAPSFVISLLHVNNRAIGALVVAIVFASSILTQLSLQRVSLRIAIGIGLTILTVALVLLPIALSMASFPLFLISAVLTGGGQGLSQRGSLAMMNLIAPPDRRGEVLSSYYVIGYIGAGLPALCLGFLSEYTGLYLATLSLTVILIVIALGTIITHLKNRQVLRRIGFRHYS